ncbi:ATP-binding protein [Candidatus Photodesmus katoptron]|uniref:ATP-binding protein n=1 Tax=Candidatus Photodesmus anomalopis TaxID=28176 RepID=UPI00069804D0|nr:AAA family ATPase [Candidatus Photodesmus katoptron]
MSMEHYSHVLELDSQTKLLERLQLLVSLSSNLVTVSGELGSGKSWLAIRYLEAWVNDKNQSFLICHSSQDDEQRRSTILNQVMSAPVFDPKDSLSTSLNHILNESSCDLIIVVDDAHLLSVHFISELWNLVLIAKKKSIG